MKLSLSSKRDDLKQAQAVLEDLRRLRPEWSIYVDLAELRAGAFWTQTLDGSRSCAR